MFRNVANDCKGFLDILLARFLAFDHPQSTEDPHYADVRFDHGQSNIHHEVERRYRTEIVKMLSQISA